MLLMGKSNPLRMVIFHSYVKSLEADVAMGQVMGTTELLQVILGTWSDHFQQTMAWPQVFSDPVMPSLRQFPALWTLPQEKPEVRLDQRPAWGPMGCWLMPRKHTAGSDWGVFDLGPAKDRYLSETIKDDQRYRVDGLIPVMLAVTQPLYSYR